MQYIIMQYIPKGSFGPGPRLTQYFLGIGNLYLDDHAKVYIVLQNDIVRFP